MSLPELDQVKLDLGALPRKQLQGEVRVVVHDLMNQLRVVVEHVGQRLVAHQVAGKAIDATVRQLQRVIAVLEPRYILSPVRREAGRVILVQFAMPQAMPALAILHRPLDRLRVEILPRRVDLHRAILPRVHHQPIGPLRHQRLAPVRQVHVHGRDLPASVRPLKAQHLVDTLADARVLIVPLRPMGVGSAKELDEGHPVNFLTRQCSNESLSMCHRISWYGTNARTYRTCTPVPSAMQGRGTTPT